MKLKWHMSPPPPAYGEKKWAHDVIAELFTAVIVKFLVPQGLLLNTVRPLTRGSIAFVLL